MRSEIPARRPLAGLFGRWSFGIPHLGRLISAQGLPFMLVACVNVVMVVVLTPAERGRGAAIVSGGSLVASVGFLNLHLGVVARYRTGDRSAPRRGLLVIGGISLALLFLAGVAWVMSLSLGALEPGDIGLALAGASLTVVALYGGRLLQALEGASAYLFVAVGQAAVYSAAVVALAALGRLTPTSAALAWVAGAGAGATLGIGRMRRLLRERRSQRYCINGVVGPALNGHLATCAYQLLYRSDVILLAALATAEELGHYVVAVAVAEVIWQFAEAVALSTYAEGGVSITPAERAIRLRAHIRAYRSVALPLALFAFVGIYGVVTLLLPAYRPAAWLFLLLLPGVVGGGELRIRLGSLNADAGAGRSIRFLAVGAAVSCLLYLPAIAIFGAPGAAVATTFVYILNAAAASRQTSFRGRYNTNGSLATS